MSAPAETVSPVAVGQDKESLARPSLTPERRLVAILSSDVKDYSRLMGADEVGTLRTLTSYRATMAALIAQHRGRVVNAVGDNLLAEFASAVDAVQCAAEIQRTLQKRNAPLPRDQRMEFRIGLNVGDVIMIEEGQIYGDGVNIAARLEQLAEAGGLCISGTVYDQIENKLALRWTYLGEQTVKNITQPIRVYQVQREPEAEAQTSSSPSDQPFFFSPFQLDVGNACLWRGKKRISLTPKDFAVLHYLVLHPQQLVKHEELFEAVWADIKVSPGVLKVCLRRIRQALGDSPTKPRFIETKHRQGYRFIAPLITPPPVPSSQFSVSSPQPEPAPSPQPLAPNFVGRGTELQRLQGWLEKALQGERQIVFITGEPGIGKTTVVDAFLKRVSAQGRIAIGRGQCIEHYGSGEAYLPVLEALGRLCREPGGIWLVDWLRQHAPTWLVQMPALLNTIDFEALQRRVQGVTRERMLREMLEAVEVLTEQQPFVLVLEDLHWSDVSTVELVAAAARRQERARLLILGTYRPVEMLSKEHPLNEVMQELYAHNLCAELALGLLSEGDVAEYLRTRFPINALPANFTRALHQWTEGNPLFLVNVVNDLVGQEVIAQDEEGWTLQGDIEVIEGQVPENIRHLIAKQSKRLLPAEQHILQAASVAGMEFSTAAVAAALEADVAEVEEWCAGLADRQHFLRRMGVSRWPDGTVGERYGFLHGLYQYLWHERVGIERRRLLHLRIGERQEAAYGNRVNEIAAELAIHFAEGRAYQRAIKYSHRAAINALRRSAYQEAISHLTKALEHLRTLPETVKRAQQELSLQTNLGRALIAAQGWAAPEAAAAYARAGKLCQQLKETVQFFPVLFGQWSFHLSRGEHQEACELGRRLLHLAQRQKDTSLLVEAHWTLGCSLFFLGELVAAHEQLEQGLSLYERQKHSILASLYGQDPGVSSLCYSALTLWRLGYPEQALQRSQMTLALARELNHPFSLTWAVTNVALLYQLCREDEMALALIKEGLALSTEHGFGLVSQALSLMWESMFVAPDQGEKGVAQMEKSIEGYRATGVEMYMPSELALLAAVYGRVGQLEKGQVVVAEALALVDKTEERHSESELYRLKGELLRQQARNKSLDKSRVQSLEAEAEACFHKALQISRQQQAKIFELRAVMSLGRLWQHQGKRAAARDLLAEVYNWFSEGLETFDLKQAKALLEKLSNE